MTTKPDLDEVIFADMRSMYAEGRSIAQICEHVWSSLGLEKGDSMSAVRYFWKGISLTLRDARLIEASPVCGGTAITEDELEQKLRPKLDSSLASRRSSQSTKQRPTQ